MDPAALNHLQLDALREVTQIGCGAGATALSQLLGGRRVGMTVAEAHVEPHAGLEARIRALGDRLVGVALTLRGGAEGRLYLVWSEEDAERLSRLLASARGEDEAVLDSALMEVGNIVASAYLNAVAQVTGLMLLPSVPRLAKGAAASVAAAFEVAGEEAERALVLETLLEIEDARCMRSHVFIVPDRASLDVLLGTLGL